MWQLHMFAFSIIDLSNSSVHEQKQHNQYSGTVKFEAQREP
jgi:hypothetical protein